MTALRFGLGIPLHFGVLDLIEIEPIGLVRLIGWSKNLPGDSDNVKLYIDSMEISRLNMFFAERSDLPKTDLFAGFCFEYYLPKETASGPLRLEIAGQEIWQRSLPADLISPDYENLLSDPNVLNRNEIYGYGLPNSQTDPVIAALLSGVTGRILDFGCGSGAIVRHLCARGIDALGIEIDRPAIVEAIGADIRPRITLYDGEFPMPFSDGWFDVVIAAEVIEHIPDFRRALHEIARVCGGTFIMTVPDMSAIPLCFPHNVVPWHMLESTHVNFFNQTSLRAELAPYFTHIEFGRLHPMEINGTTFYTSLIARCYN